jgi:hypothetical protein
MFEQTQPTSGVDRRTAPRAQVACPARWDHRRLEGQDGELLDISSTGLFLRPEGGTVRFRPNDVVWGAIEIQGKNRVFSAIVRWRGWSLEHRCVGLGLQLETHCQFHDDELAAVRWPQDANGRPALRIVKRPD